jgi:hypothetical protein
MICQSEILSKVGSSGAIVIFDDFIEFIEQAGDMCADTADYIVMLSGRE